tara:strand:+ start:90 stop:230 length:141 start_codon:yes stop_codon:yes gene_type:complete
MKRNLENLFDQLRELKIEEEEILKEIEDIIFGDEDNFDNYDDEEDI